MRWAAMLRGVNLGKRTLRKEALVAAAEAARFTGARTLLASGNLVFEADDAPPEAVQHALHAAVLRLHGIDAAVFVRHAVELATVAAANPFSEVARERPGALLVLFHDEAFPAALLAVLAERHDGPERFVAIGRELFIDFPNGQGQSALAPTMTKLKFPRGTGRNWNTVLKLAAMTAA